MLTTHNSPTIVSLHYLPRCLHSIVTCGKTPTTVTWSVSSKICCHVIVTQHRPLQNNSLPSFATSVANWYIYIPNFKNLVYFQSAWYIIFSFGIYENFGIYLSEGLVEILNQFIWFITKRKQRNRQWCWSYIKKFSDFAWHGSKHVLWVSGKWDWKRAAMFWKNWS